VVKQEKMMANETENPNLRSFEKHRRDLRAECEAEQLQIWQELMAESRSCQRTWGMGFPVISTELLRKYWEKATGFLPPTRNKS
jgi:hypothetical protein